MTYFHYVKVVLDKNQKNSNVKAIDRSIDWARKINF